MVMLARMQGVEVGSNQGLAVESSLVDREWIRTIAGFRKPLRLQRSPFDLSGTCPHLFNGVSAARVRVAASS